MPQALKHTNMTKTSTNNIMFLHLENFDTSVDWRSAIVFALDSFYVVTMHHNNNIQHSFMYITLVCMQMAVDIKLISMHSPN